MQQHAQSPRFNSWDAKQTPYDFAGYVRYTFNELKQESRTHQADLQESELITLQEFWILPNIFEDEICKGYEQKKVASVLKDIGWLKPYPSDNDKRLQHQRKGMGRFYVLVGLMPPDQ